MRPLAHTDWLHHHLAVSGPADRLADFEAQARGAGVIPWQIDFDGMAEDLLHLLLAPPAHRRGIDAAGARVLTGQLRDEAAARHARALARVGHSTACPFDLHALIPVPAEILRRGPDDAAALAWLWEHWGTTQALRHVAVAGRAQSDAPAAAWRLGFWSADWTPWRALAALAQRWPALRFDIRPRYDLPCRETRPLPCRGTRPLP